MSFLVVAACACGSDSAPKPAAEPRPPEPAPVATVDAAPPTPPAETGLPDHRRFPDLAAALAATIPADARVVGIGELHSRVDRPSVRSSLAAFTEALPSFGDRVSDLILETWQVDPKCGQAAVKATKKLEVEVKRPEATKSELALLIEAARAAKAQVHGMRLTCDDYKKLAPEHGAADPVAMLTLTTAELTRIARSAVAYRDRQPDHRPWIVLYGGALHNDRQPAPGTEEWSYASAVDAVAKSKYVEIDLIAPELAEPDATSQRQPWFPLVATAKEVRVWQRGERSFVIILPRSPK